MQCFVVLAAPIISLPPMSYMMTVAGLANIPVLQVIAVGSGKTDDEGKVVKPNLDSGNTVLYSKYSGTEFEGENEKQYIVVRESDILAVLA